MQKTLIVIYKSHPVNYGTLTDFPMIVVYRGGKPNGTSRTFTRSPYNTHEYLNSQARDMESEYLNPEVLDMWDFQGDMYQMAKTLLDACSL